MYITHFYFLYRNSHKIPNQVNVHSWKLCFCQTPITFSLIPSDTLTLRSWSSDQISQITDIHHHLAHQRMEFEHESQEVCNKWPQAAAVMVTQVPTVRCTTNGCTFPHFGGLLAHFFCYFCQQLVKCNKLHKRYTATTMKTTDGQTDWLTNLNALLVSNAFHRAEWTFFNKPPFAGHKSCTKTHLLPDTNDRIRRAHNTSVVCSLNARVVSALLVYMGGTNGDAPAAVQKWNTSSVGAQQKSQLS